MDRRTSMRIAALVAMTSTLASCAAVKTDVAAIKTDAAAIEAKVSIDAATAILIWGIIKGIGEVALEAVDVLDPPAGLAITAGIATVEGLLGTLPAIASNAEATATALGTIVSTMHTVLIAAAPAISVIPNTKKA
jgi:hypothetical protein